MLIYCSRIFLVPKSATEDVLKVAAAWLRRKGQSIGDLELMGDGVKSLPDNSTVEWVNAVDADSASHAIRYKHLDRNTRYRSWLTEVGVYHNASQFVCSVLLRTEETSALVDMNVQTTRPLVVPDIFEHCSVAAETSGGSAIALRLTDADSFVYEVNNRDRTHPIVQISHARDGRELVSPKNLAGLLAGVATVAVIPPDVDTFELEHALSRRLCCFDGAVNIIWPPVQTTSGMIAPNYRILSHDLIAMRARSYTPENEILAAVCHRMNEAFARDHLTIEKVRAAKHRVALAEARKSVTRDDAETIKLFKRVDEDQLNQITELNSSLKQRDNVIAGLRAELEQEKVAIQALKYNLDSLSSQSPSEKSLSDSARDAIAGAMSDPATLRDALNVLSALYPGRLIILESAWKSADEAEKFKSPRKAFELLNRLCSDYWQSLSAGKSDVDARACFGNNSFAAKESETVENNKKARKLRTFVHDGKPIEMMMHLKIGIKPSVAETFRAHFHWDSGKKVIVLGHCGKHLDHG